MYHFENIGTVAEGIEQEEQWDLICGITVCPQQSGSGETHTSPCTGDKTSLCLLKHKHGNIHLKRNVTQMHMKHFPFLTSVPGGSWHPSKASSWSERLFPSFPLRLFTQLSASPLSDRLWFFKGCWVEEGGTFPLTARQSMVEVDVAQVFRRTFWQAHLVVVVDQPPAGGRGGLVLPEINVKVSVYF